MHDTCVDTKSNPGNCGSCGHACPAVPHGTPLCLGGTCSFVCVSAGVDAAGAYSDIDMMWTADGRFMPPGM